MDLSEAEIREKLNKYCTEDDSVFRTGMTLVGGGLGPGSVSTNDGTITDDAHYEDNDTDSVENELLYPEDDENGDDPFRQGIDCNDGDAEDELEEEQSSASSGADMKGKQIASGDDVSIEGTVTTGRRRQRTMSSSGGLLGKNRRREPIMRTQTRTIYTAGRPPWYNTDGQHIEPCVIGICGGSASGKTTVADKIIQDLNIPWVTRLSMDCFYKVLNEKQHNLAGKNEYNFDHPDAFDFPLLIETIQRLREGKKVEVPVYNFVTHGRESNCKTMYGANVIIFEGIFTFYDPEVMKLLDIKVFVDTDADTRLARRLRRDISERGRDLNGVLLQYQRFVKPSFDSYIAPQMAHADIIVPRGGDNDVAINLIVQHVHSELHARELKVRDKLVEGWHKDLLDSSTPTAMPESLFVLPSTRQILGLHTFIRAKDTPRDEFIFYSKRLIRLLIEYSMSLLPFKDVVVESPQNILYKGKRAMARKICGVSILRAGETMEQALNDVLKEIRIGKILIQTNKNTGEPELYYLRLPRDIADYVVMLMDATVATGAASMMAIRILLDHDVPEQNIMLLSLLMAQSGVHSIAYAFPRVKIVTTAVDPEINSSFHVIPGIGNFGDRYFGTEPCGNGAESDDCIDD
ncbi:uridine-cytidine kinase-like 1 isoform X2 [Folsomia candida]|uniref:uridine-cytidine kinase-like 1 isoform X2 n=1 Tax=Folsomia candida TaxID=158441 RepID=UPI000B8F96F3|nr:uridine-cytidine kinase-like 1 isoform X2 [Folsomia candida]